MFLLVLGEEGGGTGAPVKLLELLDVLFAEEIAFEVVEVVAVFDLGLLAYGTANGKGDERWCTCCLNMLALETI